MKTKKKNEDKTPANGLYRLTIKFQVLHGFRKQPSD
jgi:hypothetical protein